MSNQVSQFAKPRGLMGRIVGQLLAVKNKQRSLWVLEVLNLKADDRVFEIGFGPGVDIKRVSEKVSFVAGIDYSALMVKMAENRNTEAVKQGKVVLKEASADEPLPFADSTFNKVFAINSFQFWQTPAKTLAEIKRILQPGGLIAIVVQPREKAATDQSTQRVGQKLVRLFNEAGFEEVELKIQPAKPTAIACALGYKL
jgi:ubiquinone/menaquinone biosynthesis C-methylase UbiE